MSKWQLLWAVTEAILVLMFTVMGLWVGLVQGDYQQGTYYLVLVTMSFASTTVTNTTRRRPR